MSMRDQIAKAIAGRIKAWHASPHDFDRVDLSKIGSGQGAQSYGPGFYAAENPKVSGVGGEYWQEFARNFTRGGDVTGDAVELLQTVGGDRAAALANIENQIKNQRPGPYSERVGTRLREVRDLLASDKQVGPRVYELDIRARPEQFLNWDLPRSAQSPEVVEGLNRIRPSITSGGQSMFPPSMPGREIVSQIMRGPAGDPVTGMQQMRDAGIPGIRYADAHTRALGADNSDRIAALAAEIAELRAGGHNLRASELDQTLSRLERTAAIPRTYNYVINDPSIIDIRNKFAIPGALGAAAAPELLGGAAVQDQYQ